MIYPIHSSAILDVTKPPYCADNTGQKDCTEVLQRVLEDFLQREIDGVQKTYEKLMKLSNNGENTVYDGFENRVYDSSRVEVGVNVIYPEVVPDSKIIYFPAGTYLVSDTVTYLYDNLKNIYLSKPLSELCRSIHIMGESQETTTIKLADSAKGFEKGKNKPVLSFVNVSDCMERGCSNVCQNNTIEDITIDCGAGNDGAVGLRFISINSGKIDNVTVKSSNSYCGIECAAGATFSMVNANVSGFDYAVHMPISSVSVIDGADFSQNRLACIKTSGSKLVCKHINSGDIPTIEFYETERYGMYYLADKNMTYIGDKGKSNVYYENADIDINERKVPVNHRSTDVNDWVCVDDFGAKGDGKTDNTEAIQKALNSGKPIVIFGSGHYLINDVITVPSTVKTIDFMYCDLFAGEKLINTKNGGVFDINQASDEMLFIENLYTFEQFYGYLRFIKHSAKRDLVMRNIHNQASATYLNTVGGSRVYMDNCASTTGSYAYNCVLAKDIDCDDYSYVIPYEFHNQKVYGMQVNPERSHIEVLNDNSDIVFDAYKVEGPGVAVKTVNGGKTIVNIATAGIGYIYAENALLETVGGNLEIKGMIIGDSADWVELRYKYLSDIDVDGVSKKIKVADIKDINENYKRLNYFNSNDSENFV